MRIAIILVLASLGIALAAALYVLIAHYRNGRPIAADKKEPRPEREGQSPTHSTPPAQSRQTVSDEMKTPFVDGSVTPLPEVASLSESPTPAVEGVVKLPVEQRATETFESAPIVNESATTPEEKQQIDVTFPEGGEHPPATDCAEEKAKTAETFEPPNARPSANEQAETTESPALPIKEIQQPESPPHVPPEIRGGHPRTAEQKSQREAAGSRRRSLKPEVVCWKRDREWILGIEVPEMPRGSTEISFFQNDARLMKDIAEERCWQLARLDGVIVAHMLDSESENADTIDLGKEGYLVFKLAGTNLNRGRRVKQPSSGSYLVIVPEDWKRFEELAGVAPAVPEHVCINGYQAHFFDLEKSSSSRIAFQNAMGQPILISSSGPRFELVGNEVHDANDDIGPLYGGPAPRICIRHGTWGSVGTVVLGEEGGGRGRSRASFIPNPELEEQMLPEEIIRDKAGWYFVRFYNLEDELIDSLDFRFVAGLRGITVNGNEPFPSVLGHKETTVEFQHDAEYIVERSSEEPDDLKVERTSEKTVVTVPPVPMFDRTRWFIGPPGGPKMKIVILVERIWWDTSDEKTPPAQWKDKQLCIAREYLFATSAMAVWFRFPREKWTRAVELRFNQGVARRYPGPATTSTVAVPLRDFGDVREINAIGEFLLGVRVSHQETTYEASVCKLLVRASCKFDAFTACTEDEMLQHVKADHLPEFVRALDWDELRQRIPNLPAEIYRCAYCCTYVRSDSGASHPTDAIIHHIKVTHGQTPIRFSRVTDLDQIRQNVIANVPRIHRCNECSREFEDFDEVEVWRHLVINHRTDLFDIVKS